MKIEYAYYWMIHAIYCASSDGNESKFELTIIDNQPDDFELSIYNRKQALSEIAELSFIKVTEKIDIDSLDKDQYYIEIDRKEFVEYYKKITNTWVLQLREMNLKKIQKCSSSTKERIILVIDLIMENYEITQVSARPKKLDYLRIPIEKFTANSISYEDVKYAITSLWQGSRMITKKHIQSNSLHIQPFPEFTFEDVISDLKQFKQKINQKTIATISQNAIDEAKQTHIGNQHRIIRDTWLNTKRILDAIKKNIQPLLKNDQKITLYKKTLPKEQQIVFSSVMNTLYDENIISLKEPKEYDEDEIISFLSSQFDTLSIGGIFYIIDIDKFNIFHNIIINTYYAIQHDGNLRFPNAYPNRINQNNTTITPPNKKSCSNNNELIKKVSCFTGKFHNEFIFVINDNYECEHIIRISADKPKCWVKLINIIKGDKEDIDKSIYHYFNSKNHPFVKKLGYKKTQILEEASGIMKLKIASEFSSKKALSERKNKLTKLNKT